MPFFVIKGSDGDILVKSALYTSQMVMDNALHCVKDDVCVADVVDMTDSTQPVVVGSVGTGAPDLMRVEGGPLIVVGTSGGLWVCGTQVSLIDLADPTSPDPIGGELWWAMGSGCEDAGAAFDGRFLYISRYGSDVRAIDPWAPWDAEGFTRVTKVYRPL